MTSVQWVEYHVGTKRKSYNTLPTSNITAETVTMGGFTLSQTDNAGVTTTNTRSYTANGMIQTRTDGRELSQIRPLTVNTSWDYSGNEDYSLLKNITQKSIPEWIANMNTNKSNNLTWKEK